MSALREIFEGLFVNTNVPMCGCGKPIYDCKCPATKKKDNEMIERDNTHTNEVVEKEYTVHNKKDLDDIIDNHGYPVKIKVMSWPGC